MPWNKKPPHAFERLGFAGFLEVPFAIDKMMDKFKNSLSNKKMANFNRIEYLV